VLNSIEEDWLGFAKAIMPKDASQMQYNQMRTCFYAGYFSLLINCEAMGHPAIPEEVGVQFMQDRKEEIIKHKDELFRKGAERN